jgi:23S rRNA (uridine2552-2'-O)-methyltransferase
MSRSGGSSRRWRDRQESDPYVERARREGWRARAVYKLEELDKREHFLRRGIVCVDLGSSPGSWSQYVLRRLGPSSRVIAIDLLPMEPIPGVEFILGDFTDPAVLGDLQARCGEHAVDLVLSDMAPNISGNRDIDQPRSMQLAEEALEFASAVLRPGGDFVVKLFQGSGVDEFVAEARRRFARAKLVKPRASRAASREIYLLARRYGL